MVGIRSRFCYFNHYLRSSSKRLFDDVTKTRTPIKTKFKRLLLLSSFRSLLFVVGLVFLLLLFFSLLVLG